jgi:ribonuclease HI
MPEEKQPKKAPSKTKLPLNGIESLAGLLKHCNIDNWDTVIIGDGSGQGWKMGAGWASVLIDRASRARKLFYGAMNTGTVTLGELMPYLHALSWYTGKDGPGAHRRKEKLQQGKQMQVHIITDSQIIAMSGNNPESRHSHQELWKAFDEYRQRGFVITFHFVDRARVNLNVLVDEVSRQARVDIEETYGKATKTLSERYPGVPNGVSIYDFST